MKRENAHFRILLLAGLMTVAVTVGAGRADGQVRRAGGTDAVENRAVGNGVPENRAAGYRGVENRAASNRADGNRVAARGATWNRTAAHAVQGRRFRQYARLLVAVALPRGAVTIRIAGSTYYRANGVFYRERDGRFFVTRAPVGAVVRHLPSGAVTVVLNRNTYYRHHGVFYVKVKAGFRVVVPPAALARRYSHRVVASAAVAPPVVLPRSTSR